MTELISFEFKWFAPVMWIGFGYEAERFAATKVGEYQPPFCFSVWHIIDIDKAESSVKHEEVGALFVWEFSESVNFHNNPFFVGRGLPLRLCMIFSWFRQLPSLVWFPTQCDVTPELLQFCKRIELDPEGSW